MWVLSQESNFRVLDDGRDLVLPDMVHGTEDEGVNSMRVCTSIWNTAFGVWDG